MTITGVSPGTHTLVLKKEGYQEYTRSITITDGETLRLPNIFLLRSGLSQHPGVTYGNGQAGGPESQITMNTFVERVNTRFDKVRF